MAGGTRSSKRKSSPSYPSKKKRRNKDRVKKRGKLGRSKSKKVSRRDSPYSYSENESSASDSSVSYSSAESDHRRSRSRTRKDTRRRREKSRRRRLRSESSEDSVQVRTRKRSKRSRDMDAKKRKTRGRMHRRKSSVSSSSRSLSCSTCGYSDDSERGNERNVKRVKRSGRDLDEDRSRRSRRLRSCSSCRFGSNDYSYQSEEPMPNENNSRRLKSIITFAKECEEADTKELDRDEQKEEIVYEHDDYPSPRSNDSNDWETRREACHHSDDVPGQTGSLEDQHKEMVESSISISKLSENSDLGKVERDVNVSTFNVAGVKDSSKENSSTNAGSSDADLEAILRQKALENLKKFKGGVRADPKNAVSTKCSCDGEVKESFGLKADSEWKKEDSNINMSVSTLSDNPKDGAMPFKKEHIGTDTFMRKAHPVQESSFMNSSAPESLQSTEDSKMVTPSEEGGDFTLKNGGEGGALTSVVNVPTSGIRSTVESLQSPSNDTKGLIDSVDHAIDKYETDGASTLIECLGSSKFQSEMTPIQNSSVPDMSMPAQSYHNTKMVTDDDDITSTGLSTSHRSNLQGQSSNAKENEDEDSQFQQKTMSVMRGGERVQVSYKVYIPKRAPALARRKLKR